MKNKKGFTLVELLAVIVILGILLLIAVPAVNNIIKASRRKAFISTTKLAIENVENLVSIYGHENKTCYIPMDDDNIKLERGSYGDIKGTIVVRVTGEVYAYAYDPSSDSYIAGKGIKDMGENFNTTSGNGGATVDGTDAKKGILLL